MSIIPLIFKKGDSTLAHQKNRGTAEIEIDYRRLALGINVLFNPDGTPRELSDESFIRATDLLTEAGNKIFPTD